MVSPKKLLIIEDEEHVRDLLLERATKFHQLDCMWDDTGEACLSLAEKFRPHAILLDMALPGLSGFGVLRNLKKNPQTKDIPVVVFSAYNQRDIVNEALNAGAKAFHAKGTSMQNLFDTVMNYTL